MMSKWNHGRGQGTNLTTIILGIFLGSVFALNTLVILHHRSRHITTQGSTEPEIGSDEFEFVHNSNHVEHCRSLGTTRRIRRKRKGV